MLKAFGLGVGRPNQIENWLIEALNGWSLKREAACVVEKCCLGLCLGDLKGKKWRDF